MRRIRYLIVLLILSAAMAAVLGGYGVFAAGEPAGGVTTSTEVFKKVSGAYQGYSYEEPMATDGLSVSVSVDVPSGSFAYFGINAGPGGKGQPVSAQHGIGIFHNVSQCHILFLTSCFADRAAQRRSRLSSCIRRAICGCSRTPRPRSVW